ncbi:hypothetical protein HH800_15720 [Sphingobium yanoikuyae]|uniref:Uncharacterized protein n=1 Tax=Sphingobium yanoikuyae TaxID=13690 RepID=A0A6M4G8I0_SPHYA|nr:hypothetical protein [Sphingobium yanoikuyae]QJR03498.1 hypothetical protein HH800_15720 [Sphingobium yanoikuyae]
MAKSGWQSLIINDADAWKNAGKAKSDPVADRRAKAVASIDGALASIEAGAEPTRMTLYKVKADVARAGLRLGRRTVQLNGQDAVFVPAERLGDFYEALKASVEAGELDAELAAAAGDEAPVKRRGRRKAS